MAEICILKVYTGIPPSFSAMFLKEDNFHDFTFAYLIDEVSQNGIYSYRKELAPRGASSFQ